MEGKAFFTVRTAIILFVFFMLMNILINGAPYGLAKLNEITDGHSILDMELRGYTVDRAYEILENLGGEGRNFYLKYIVPLDFPFPLAYGLFFFVTLTLIMRSIWKNTRKIWLIGIIGIVATLFDWLENAMVINLLRSYPKRLDEVARLANIFTQLKSFFVISSMILIVVGLLTIALMSLYQKIRSKPV